MAYDEILAHRIRAALGPVPFAEKKMFGGVAFLVRGNMAIAVSSHGGILARLAPADAAALLGDGVEPMVMNGREMKGWLRVAEDRLDSDAELQTWVERCLDFVQTLPAK